MKGLRLDIKDELEKLVLENPDLTTLRKKALKLEKILKERSKRAVEINNFVSDSEDSDEINHTDRRRTTERPRRDYVPRNNNYEHQRNQDYRKQEPNRDDDRYYEQRRTKIVCYNCRKPGHYATECNLRTDRRTSDRRQEQRSGDRRDTGNNTNSNTNSNSSPSNNSNSASGPRSA